MVSAVAPCVNKSGRYKPEPWLAMGRTYSFHLKEVLETKVKASLPEGVNEQGGEEAVVVAES